MTIDRSVLVVGVTGQQGGAVADALLARGHRVRGLTRDPVSARARAMADRGAEVVAGHFEDHDSLVAAMTGVDAVFAMTRPAQRGVADEGQQGLALARAAAASGVGHFIFSSVASADRDTGIPHFDSKYAIERRLEALAIPWTVSAPVFFMENLRAPWVLDALLDGRLPMALPAERRLQQVSLADIGAFVTALVERREAVFGRRYEIAGDEPSGAEAAAILSGALGREVSYEALPIELVREQSEAMARMFEWFDRVGYSVDVAALRREFPEVAWMDFAEWTGHQVWHPPEPGLV